MDLEWWRDVTGRLRVGDHVLLAHTDGLFSPATVNLNYAPPVPEEVLIEGGKLVQVIVRKKCDIIGIWKDFLVSIPRCQVHPHRLQTIANMVISDDKKHDSAMVQECFASLFCRPGCWFETQNVIPDAKDRFTEFFTNSDNASSHFKSSKTMFYLLEFLQSSGLERVAWLFGCPMHGKGTVDGAFGVTKRTLGRHICDNLLHLHSAEEICKLATDLFENDIKIKDMKEAFELRGKGILRWCFHFVPTATVQLRRPAANEKIKTTAIKAFGFGTRNLFEFVPQPPSMLRYRIFPHWCPLCVAGREAECPVLVKLPFEEQEMKQVRVATGGDEKGDDSDEE